MTTTKNNTKTQNRKLCKWCGNPILSPYAKKFCSTSCCGKSQKVKPPRYTRIGYCANKTCGKVFSKQKNLQKRFCSRSCAAKISNAIIAASRTKKYCPNCKTKAIPNPNKFCSHKCHSEYEEKRKIVDWLETGDFEEKHNVPKFVRRYLMREQDNKCAICGCPPFWNGKDLVFVADHIDGNSNNNCRDNLRMIDPICDSQLPTYKGGNVGNGRKWRRERYADGKSY